MMNISVGDYTIKYTPGIGCTITKKGDSRVTNVDITTVFPNQISSQISSLSYDRALFKMQTAYETGKWPTDPCPHCGRSN